MKGKITILDTNGGVFAFGLLLHQNNNGKRLRSKTVLPEVKMGELER